jgi:hypothetical protein
MTDAELDDTYTALCEALAAAGEPAALPLLSRFALLAMVEIDEPETLRTLIRRAAKSLSSETTNPPKQGAKPACEPENRSLN